MHPMPYNTLTGRMIEPEGKNRAEATASSTTHLLSLSRRKVPTILDRSSRESGICSTYK
jgi:hypothetical protein